MSEIKFIIDDREQIERLKAVEVTIARIAVAVLPRIEFTIGPITKQERP